MGTLDECRVCHARVLDYEEGGYEGNDGQRGHFVCDGKSKQRGRDRYVRLLTLHELLSAITRRYWEPFSIGTDEESDAAWDRMQVLEDRTFPVFRELVESGYPMEMLA